MFANTINVLALATVAANLVPAALAAPAPASTVNNAIPHSVNPVTQDVIEERGAGVKIGSALAGTLASLITGGVADHLFGRDVALKLGESGISLMIGDDGTVYANTSEGQGVSKRGWAAIGKAVAGGVASGAAASILNNLFGRDAALMVGEDGTAYMVDDDGTIYANLPEEQGVSKRAVSPALGKALGAIGTAVAGGLASGASEASISEIFHKFNTRDMEVEEKRAFGAIISILQNLFHKREEEVSVAEKRSWAAIGKAVAGGVASGAAVSVLNNLVSRDAALMIGDDGNAFMVDDDGMIYANLPDEQPASKRDISATIPGLEKLFGRREVNELD